MYVGVGNEIARGETVDQTPDTQDESAQLMLGVYLLLRYNGSQAQRVLESSGAPLGGGDMKVLTASLKLEVLG